MRLEKIDKKTVVANLKMIQDEFRRLSITFPPIYHERFVSLIPMVEENWMAFANANRVKDDSWEEWNVGRLYREPTYSFALGRFFGEPDGFDQFEELAKSLSFVLVQLGFISATADWLSLIHYLAENLPSPLLYCARLIWKRGPSHHVENKEGKLEPLEDFLLELEKDESGVEYATHPLQRTLKQNVFSSSVVALELILDSSKLLDIETTHGFMLPNLLKGEDAVNLGEQLEVKYLADPKSVPEYIFKYMGNRWIIRYEDEFGTFGNHRGFHHIAKILSSSFADFGAEIHRVERRF